MFTGIVEEIGEVQKITNGEKSSKLSIKAKKVLSETKIGDSIAVNGTCLTVVEIGEDYFMADVMSETKSKSSLSKLRNGSLVNLERAMPLNGRFSGHIVSGHIDGTGIIENIKKDDNAVWYTIKADEKILRYIVLKGSVTIDGISLTVADVNNATFKVSVIPHTQQVTILSGKLENDIVNIECDVLGKYVEKLLLPQKEDKKSNLSEQFFIDNGFM